MAITAEFVTIKQIFCPFLQERGRSTIVIAYFLYTELDLKGIGTRLPEALVKQVNFKNSDLYGAYLIYFDICIKNVIFLPEYSYRNIMTF